MDKQRIYYFDFLRVLSVFFVIVIHITSVGLQGFEIATAAWIVNSLINSVSRWAVPIFFMVSGALFLAADKRNLNKEAIPEECMPDSCMYYRVGAFLFTVGSISVWSDFSQKHFNCSIWDHYRKYRLSYVVSLHARDAIHCGTAFPVDYLSCNKAAVEIRIDCVGDFLASYWAGKCFRRGSRGEYESPAVFSVCDNRLWRLFSVRVLSDCISAQG